MNSRRRLTVVAVLLAAASGFGRPEMAEPKHLRDARILLQSLTPDGTSYRHKNGEVRWPGTNGAAVCHTDCSGFLDALLKHSYGYDRKRFETWMGSGHPTAARYHDAIAGEGGFQRIAHLADARPGDILAIKYPPGSSNTGHVMLVAGSPRKMRPSPPLADGTDQWEVPIIDCSHSGHGASDNRHLANGKSREGLGRGVLRIYSTPSGAVAGHTWSTSAKSEYIDQGTRHLEIGRLQPANDANPARNGPLASPNSTWNG